MPLYSVQTPKGTYKVDAPEGSNRDFIIGALQEHAPEAFAPPQDKPFSDFGSYVKQGALGATQNVFDVTGINNPVSDWMGRQQDSIQFSEAEKARQQRAAEIKKEAEGKGMVAGGLAALHAFGTDWKSLTGQAIGSLAPVAAPFLAAGAAAVAAPEIATAVGVGTIAEMGSAALGLAMGAGGMKRGMYQAVKDTLTEHGIDKDKVEEAATKASEYTGPNAAFIAGGGLLGIIDSVTGVGNRAANALATRVAAKVVGKEAAEKAAVATGEKVAGEAAGKAATTAVDTDAKKKAEEKLGHAVLKDMVKEAGTEAGENAFQQIGSNVAQTNAGVQTDPFAGVGEQAVEGAIGGGLAGGLATGALQMGNRASVRMRDYAEKYLAEPKAAEGAKGPISPEAQKYLDLNPALTPEEAQLHADFIAREDARKAGQPPPGSPTGINSVEGVQPVVRGVGTDVQGAGGRDAAGRPTGEIAEPATGGLVGAEPSPRGFTATEGFDDRPLRVQKAERRANPITPEDVKTGLDSFVADNNLGITVPDRTVKRITTAANEAHVAGEPKTLAELIEQVTKATAPKDVEQTIRALQPAVAQLGGMPQGVTLGMDDVQAIHDQVVAGRGLITTAKALDNVVTAKVQALEAPPVAPVVPVAPVNPVAEQSHANMEAPPEVSSKPPVDTAIGEKTVADADIKAQVDPASIPGTETKKAELADAIAADQASPDPVLTPETKAATEQGVAQGMDPAIPLAEINKAKAEQAQEAPPPVAPVAEAPPALTEPSATTPDEAQQAQEPVSEPANEGEPPLPANLAAMMPGEGAPAAVPGEAPVTPEAGAGEAPAVATPDTGEAPVSPEVQRAADELNATAPADMNNPSIVAAGDQVAAHADSDPAAAVADEAAVADAATTAVAAKEQGEAATEAAKPPIQSRARKQQTADDLTTHPAVARLATKRVREKIAAGGDTEENMTHVGEALNDAVEAHDNSSIPDGVREIGPPDPDGMQALPKKMPYEVYKKFVAPLLTSSLVKMHEAILPHLRGLYRIIGQSQGYRLGFLRGFDKIGKDFKAFVKKYGPEELADAMSISKSVKHDASLFTSREDALLNDPAIKYTKAAMQDPKFQTKQGKGLKKDREALERREAEINFVWDAWDKLGAQEGGQELYTRLKDFHKYTSNMVKMLRDKTVKSIGLMDEAAADRLSQFLNSQMDPESFTSKNGRDITYRHVPAGEMPSVYFPTKRYGTFWIGVKEGPAGREYYQFETHSQMKAGLERLAKHYGIDPNSPQGREFFSTGDDKTKLRESMTKESAVVQKIMREVEAYPINGKTEIIRERQRQQLKDAVFQSYLQSLPDKSLSKNMIHYEDITGGSEDIVRNFGTVSRQLANLMTTLKYGSQADSLFRSAAEYLRPSDETAGPLDRDTTMKLEYLLSMVHERLMLAVNPPVRNGLLDKIITIGNRAGVVWYMSSAGTAFANMTAIPVRVMPRLLADHGPRAIPVLTKFADLIDTLSLKGDNGEWTTPNIRNSAYVKNHADLKAGMELGQRWGVFESSYDPQIGTKSSDTGTVAAQIAEAGRLATKAATIGIAATETISREQAFAAGYLLQLPKELKKGGTRAEAQHRAAEYASNMVDDTIGQFSAAEYPKMIGQGIGRALFLFKRFSFIQSKFLWGSAYNIVRSMAKGDIKATARATAELSMSLGMVTAFAGLTGLPMYSMIMGLHDWWDDKFLTPEEKAARAEQYGVAAFNADLRFRFHDLPRMLNYAQVEGPDGFQHSLSNILMNGPFSELTDANIGSRVSIDHLWFRGFQQGNNLGEVALNTLAANIANVSLATNMLNGMDDIQNGDAVRGMEKLMPAGLKGAFTAYRYATEGARTRNNYTMLNPEDFTIPNMVALVGGLQPTKLATVQLGRMSTAAVIKQAGDDQKKVMEEFRKGMVDYNSDPSTMEKFWKDVEVYNKKYPLEELQISYDTLKSSIETMLRNRNATYEGTTVTKKNYKDILPTLVQTAPVQGGLPSDYTRH